MDYTQKQSAPSLRKADLALAVLFCAVVGIGCLTIIVRMGTRVLMKLDLCSQPIVNAVFFDNVLMKEDFARRHNKLPAVNWQALYPLSEETVRFYEGTIDSRDSLKDKSRKLVLQIPKATAAIAQVNTWLNGQFIARYFFIEMIRRVQKPCGIAYLASIDETGEAVDKLPNGHLTKFTKKIDSSPAAASLIRFNEFLSTRGIPLLYVQAPRKVDPADTSVSGKLDFSNQNADELLHLIDGEVDYMDLRDEMQKAGMDHYESFYLTDHHWKTETGFWATRVIAQRLNADFQLGLDDELLDPANFNFEVLPESFLGSHGRAATLVLADMEDFSLITPKDEYDLDVEIYPSDYLARKASGSFELFIFPELFQTKKTAYAKDSYHAHLKGDSIIFVRNNSAQNDLRILLIGDSFANCVKCFLPLCVKNFDALDLRGQRLKHFNGSLSAFIDAHERYDACIMLVSAGAIDTEEFFDFR